MPIRGVPAGACPNEALNAQSTGDLQVFKHILFVVKVNEPMAKRLAKDQQHGQQQKAAHKRRGLRGLLRVKRLDFDMVRNTKTIGPACGFLGHPVNIQKKAWTNQLASFSHAFIGTWPIHQPASGTPGYGAFHGEKSGRRSSSFRGSAEEGAAPMAKCSFKIAGSKTIVWTVSRPMFTSSIFFATSATPS